MTQWAQQQAAQQSTVRVAWLGLDSGDDDAVLFWSYLIAARALSVAPGVGDAALATIGGPDGTHCAMP